MNLVPFEFSEFRTFSLLKRIIAISLLSIYLFSTTELHQLLKIPFLVEHFIEHKDDNHEITLWQFLSLHYQQNNTKDADYENDMKLPFKSHDCCNILNFAGFIAQPLVAIQFISRPEYQFRSTNFPNFIDKQFDNAFLSNIWQPPRTI